jgi:hypothetical protein
MEEPNRWRAPHSTTRREAPELPSSPGKKRARVLFIVAAVIVIPPTYLVGSVAYTNWSAERKARAFCAATQPGSDIHAAIARADEMKVYHSGDVASGSQSFMFPGYFVDTAYCDVTVDGQGRVVSTHAEMLYD